MQRKTKKFLTNLIIVLFICSAVVFIALHVHIGNNEPEPVETGNEIENTEPEPIPFTEPEVDENYAQVGFNLGSFLCKDIYINGYHINNWPPIDLKKFLYEAFSQGIFASFMFKKAAGIPSHQ